MGLGNCSKCGNALGANAAACPKCGKKQLAPGKTRSLKKSFIIFFVIAVIVSALIANYMSRKPAAATETNPVTAAENSRTTSKSEPLGSSKEDACKLDLHCWAKKNIAAATFHCESVIIKKSRFNARWTDRFLEPKFTHLAWLDQSAGTIVYIGDEVEFQNAAGDYAPQIYRCDFDPSNQTVLQVSTIPGQLKD